MMVLPFLYLLFKHPDSVSAFFAFGGEDGANGKGVNFGSVMLAAGVCLSLIAQIAEQIDYLRFMPPKTPENTRRWWAAVILAGPGWVIFGAFKQIVGLFLAVYIIANVVDGSSIANQPVHQFLEIYQDMMPHWLAMTLAVILVVISQIKINVTNAYSGSLAWTNSYTRVTKTYPGRMVFVLVNLAIALILMEANMFDFLNTILGFYANCGIAWVVVVASDIAINKYWLKLSPKVPRVPTRDALRRQPRRLRVDAAGRGSVDPGVLRRFRFDDQAVLPDRRDRHRTGDAAGPGRRHQGKVLPTTHRRRHRSADVRRVREPLR